MNYSKSKILRQYGDWFSAIICIELAASNEQYKSERYSAQTSTYSSGEVYQRRILVNLTKDRNINAQRNYLGLMIQHSFADFTVRDKPPILNKYSVIYTVQVA